MGGGYRRLKAYDYFMCLPGSVSQWLSEVESDDAYLILEKVEPKRESRWGWFCCAHHSLAAARAALKPEVHDLIRADYEDGKLVAVTLEPEGEGA